MSSGYEQFHNVESAGDAYGANDVPPQYEKSQQDNGGEMAQSPSQPPQYRQAAPPQTGYPQQSPAQYPIHSPGTYVYQPGQYGQVPMQQTMTHVPAGPIPKDYFGFALFVTICCCLPFGIVALIRSSESRNRSAVGDALGANLASADAKRYSWIGCIIGGVTWVSILIGTAVYIGVVVAACNQYGC